MNKASKTIVSIVALVAVIGSWFYYKNYIYEEQDISKWKTYQDEKYSFEIKYPPHWEATLERDNSLMGFVDKRKGDWTQNLDATRGGFYIIDLTRHESLINKTFDSLEDYLRYYSNQVPKANLVLTRLKTADDKEALRQIYSSEKDKKPRLPVVSILSPNRLIYDFIFEPEEDKNGTLKKMISTFRFLDIK